MRKVSTSPARIAFAALLVWAANAKAATTISSPDNAVRCDVVADNSGLQYSVKFRDQPVIEQSAIAVSIDGTNIAAGVESGQLQQSEINETYPYRGVHSQAVNRCRSAIIPLTHRESGTRFSLEVRVFNDGAAFRYVIPSDEQKSRIPDDDTT